MAKKITPKNPETESATAASKVDPKAAAERKTASVRIKRKTSSRRVK